MTRGMTLIEAVVLVAVSTLALIALVNLFLIFNFINGYQRAFIATAGSAGNAMNALSALVLQADSVVSSYAVSGRTHTSGAQTLVLKLPAVDSAGDLISGGSDYVVFYSLDTALYRIIDPHPQSMRLLGTTTLSTALSSLSFTYDTVDLTTATTVAATIETSASFKNEIIESSLSERWYLRNTPLQ